MASATTDHSASTLPMPTGTGSWYLAWSGGSSCQCRCYVGELGGAGVAPAEEPHRDVRERCDRFVCQLIGRQRRDDGGQPRRSLSLATVEDRVHILLRAARGTVPRCRAGVVVTSYPESKGPQLPRGAGTVDS